MNGTINELKQGLLQCANENEDRTYLTGQVSISSICKDAKNTIEELEQKCIDMNKAYLDLVNGLIIDYRELEKENEQLKQQIDKLKEEKQYGTCPYRSTDMGCDYCDYRDRDLKDEVEE